MWEQPVINPYRVKEIPPVLRVDIYFLCANFYCKFGGDGQNRTFRKLDAARD